MKKLSIVISNRNDTAMLSVTVNSCIEELRPLGLKNCEIVICDNSDENTYKLLRSCLPIGYMRDDILKIYRQDFPCLFTARETAIAAARSENVLCLDSHMLSGRDMILDMYNFMEDKKDDPKLGFVHAPINWSHHHQRNAVHDRDMSVNELGNWNTQYKNIKKITWKGMPWICRKSFWNSIHGYGALSQHSISWGGGDMHIGIKPWLLGYENWAIPCNPGIHIGPFPKIDTIGDNSSDIKAPNGDGYRYRLYGNSGNGPHTLGFLISCYVLGGEAMMNRNKAAITERFGRYIDVDKWWEKAKEFGKGEKEWLDSNKKLSFEELLEQRPWNN